jgi:hypothetical protein
MMNPFPQGPQTPSPPLADDDAEMARAMKRGGGRRAFLIIGLIVAGGAGAVGLYALRAKSEVQAELEGQGYGAVWVKMKDPFTFSFDAKKGTSQCSGTISRTPFSSKREEMCFDTSPPPPKAPSPPTLSNREQLQLSLKTSYEKYGFDKFVCPDVANADEKVACTVSGPGGASAPINASLKTHDTDGSWATWSWNAPPPEFINRNDFATDVKKTLEAAQPNKRTLDVDCGTGPLILNGDPLTCKVSTATPPKEGTAKVTFDPKEPSSFHVHLDL